VFVNLIEKGRAEWEFRPVNARPFVTIEAQVSSENATQDVVRAIAREAHRLERAVVRVRIDIAPERAAELDHDEIRAQLKSAYYVAPVERTSPPRTRSRWGAAGAAIQRAGPLEALLLYLEHQHVDPERREVLLRYARQLMQPEAEIAPECTLRADAS
jgi:exonuclease SbcD